MYENLQIKEIKEPLNLYAYDPLDLFPRLQLLFNSYN